MRVVPQMKKCMTGAAGICRSGRLERGGVLREATGGAGSGRGTGTAPVASRRARSTGGGAGRLVRVRVPGQLTGVGGRVGAEWESQRGDRAFVGVYMQASERG